MTTSDHYILVSEAPGILDGTPMRGEVLAPTGTGKEDWYECVVIDGGIVTEAGDVLDPGAFPVRLDAQRPEVRDRLARWLAEKVGLEVEATAPRWEGVECIDGTFQWWLSARDRTLVFYGRQFTSGGNIIVVSIISTLTDPASALVAACKHVGGRDG